MSNWIMGIDGGGSKTTARLARLDAHGTVETVAIGTAGPSNVARQPPADVEREINSAIDAAWLAAGSPRQTLTGLVLCAAGAGSVQRRARWTEWLEQQGFARHVLVMPDVHAVLAAAFSTGPGVALVVGTGSIAMGRRADGSLVRAGGWGPWLGDEGGGFWFGCMAIRATLAALEQSHAADQLGSLATRVLNHLGCADAGGLLARLYEPTSASWAGTPLPAIKDLAPLVFAEAERDAAAHAIVLDATRALADLIVRVVQQLDRGKTQAQKTARPPSQAIDLPLPWAVAGSVCVQNSSLVTELHRLCWARGLYLEPARIIADPSAGAVQLAHRLVSERPLGTDLTAFR